MFKIIQVFKLFNNHWLKSSLVESIKLDNFIYNIAFGYPLIAPQYPPKQLNVYLEFNGNYIIDNQQNDLFISPGIQLIPHRRFILETGMQFALIEDVPDNEKTNFKYLLGTRILIF